MKNNKLWLRVLSLCLAVVCTFSIVAAATTDLSGDGKTDVWDLQKAANEGEDTTTLASILAAALGGADELHVNDKGVYEIHSPLGLYNMAKLAGDADAKFELMADVDMSGCDWTPTAAFMGTFEGGGHTIRNVNITKAVEGGSFYNQGFFSKIGKDAVVQNLKLENVTVDASALPSDKNNFIGLLTGSLTGTVQDCTTTGTVVDSRTNLTEKAYIGTLVGRIENVTTYEVPGVVLTENYTPLHAEDEEKLLTAVKEAVKIRSAKTSSTRSYEDAADVQTIKNNLSAAIGTEGQPVISKMAMDYGTLESGSAARQTGIVGWAKTDAQRMEGYNWQDISGSIDLIDPVLAERRQAVVDKMYQICTVEWTPSQNMKLHYYKVGTGDNAGKLNYYTSSWTAGYKYLGMPYNHGSGSLERFLEWMDAGTTTDYKTKTTLPTEAYYYTYSKVRDTMSAYTDTTLQTPLTYTDGDTTYDLLPGYQLADQPMTVGETVDSADHAGFSRYIGNDCSSAIQWAWRSIISSDVKNGGTVAPAVTQMTPLINKAGTVNYQTRYGVLPVGGLVPYSVDEVEWENYYDSVGQNAFLEAYSQASRGDALIMFNTAGGHSRMIAYDPVCLRDYAGNIDVDNSYIITHEQGRTSYEIGYDYSNSENWKSTCHVNCLYTFDQLSAYDKTDAEGNKVYTTGTWGLGSSGHYMPMTLPAFHDVDSKAVNAEGVVNSTVTLDGTTIKSNFYILSTTVDGNEVFTAVGQHKSTNTTYYVGSGYRDAHIQVDAKAVHGDDVTGKTVTVRLSNGDTYSVDMSTGAVTKN